MSTTVLLVNTRLRHLLDAHEGVLTRSAALAEVPRGVLEHAARGGHLHRVYPRVYIDPARRDEPRLRWRAALAYGGPRTALCGLTALAVWGVTEPTRTIHLLTDEASRLRGGSDLRVHRAAVVDAIVRGGLCVTRLERSVVDSVRQLDPSQRRAPFIEAVGKRLTTPQRLRAVVDSSANLPGRQALLRLNSLLAAGCHSELELWGHDQVFQGSGMPSFRRQYPVRLGGRTVYLDLYAEQEALDIELDGRAHHTSPVDRERDLRRDAALAAVGIMVVRFTHHRLTREPEAVRREVLEILASRRLRGSDLALREGSSR